VIIYVVIVLLLCCLALFCVFFYRRRQKHNARAKVAPESQKNHCDDKPESVSAFIPTVDTGELLAPPTVATPSKALLKTTEMENTEANIVSILAKCKRAEMISSDEASFLLGAAMTGDALIDAQLVAFKGNAALKASVQQLSLAINQAVTQSAMSALKHKITEAGAKTSVTTAPVKVTAESTLSQVDRLTQLLKLSKTVGNLSLDEKLELEDAINLGDSCGDKQVDSLMAAYRAQNMQASILARVASVAAGAKPLTEVERESAEKLYTKLRARIGVAIEENRAKDANGQQVFGAKVVGLAAGGSGEKAGLLSGDVIVSIDGSISRKTTISRVVWPQLRQEPMLTWSFSVMAWKWTLLCAWVPKATLMSKQWPCSILLVSNRCLSSEVQQEHLYRPRP